MSKRKNYVENNLGLKKGIFGLIVMLSINFWGMSILKWYPDEFLSAIWRFFGRDMGGFWVIYIILQKGPRCENDQKLGWGVLFSKKGCIFLAFCCKWLTINQLWLPKAYRSAVFRNSLIIKQLWFRGAWLFNRYQTSKNVQILDSS